MTAEVRKPWRAAPLGAELSDTEAEVLRYVADGLSNPAIAEKLNASLDAAKSHVARAMAKLGAVNRAHAVNLAHEAGLLGARSVGVVDAEPDTAVVDEPDCGAGVVPIVEPCAKRSRPPARPTIQVSVALFDEFVGVCAGLVYGRSPMLLRAPAKRALVGARAHLRDPHARGAA